MENNEILNILEDWNFWKKDLDTGIKRDFYLEKLKKIIPSEQIIAITGARRSGKSFIMKQLAKELINQGLNKNQILTVNFEDPRFIGLNTKLLQQIYEIYLEVLNPKDRPYIFLDEVQEIAGWEKWVRMTHELQKAKIIISGSNAKLLSQELATLLTGRHLDLTVFPLSFKEFLNFNSIQIKDDLDLIAKRIEIKNLLRKYFEFGSFPRVVIENNKQSILLAYFDDALNKDLIQRYKIKKQEALKSLIKFYLSNISSLITFSSLEKSLNISADTIEKFSSYFETAYLLFFLKRFSYKVKEQEKSPRKVYAVDLGLVNAIGFKFSRNIGKLAENLVFLELKRKQIINPDMELYYWKDERHREVDFVIKENSKVKQLIQVCWNLDNFKTKKREFKSLINAMDEFDLQEGLIISEEEERTEVIGNKKIKIYPLWKWLIKTREKVIR